MTRGPRKWENDGMKIIDTPEIRQIADKIAKQKRVTSAEMAKMLNSLFWTDFYMPESKILLGFVAQGWYSEKGGGKMTFFQTVEECLAHRIDGKSVAERLDAGETVSGVCTR